MCNPSLRQQKPNSAAAAVVQYKLCASQNMKRTNQHRINETTVAKQQL